MHVCFFPELLYQLVTEHLHIASVSALRTNEIPRQKWEIQNYPSSTKCYTVDGRNPASQLVNRLSHYFFPRFFPVVARISEPSIVVPDFSTNKLQSQDLIVWPGGVCSKMAVWHELEMPSGVMEDAKGGFGGMFLNHPGHQVFVMFTGWWFQIFFMFTPIWGRFPIWLIFFKWVETTNLTSKCWCSCSRVVC